MSLEVNPNGRALRVQEIEGVLRYPDGSIDIAAYAKRAHRERAMAIAASAKAGIRKVRKMVAAVLAGLAPATRSAPASGKHHAPVGR